MIGRLFIREWWRAKEPRSLTAADVDEMNAAATGRFRYATARDEDDGEDDAVT